MNKKNIFIAIFFLIFFALQYLNAKGAVFSIHLFYNEKEKSLVFDRERKEKISLDIEKNISIIEYANKKITGSYILKLYDFSDNEFLQEEFNPETGRFIYEIPYFSIAKKIEIFEKSTNKKILEADVSKYLTCDGNKVCEFEKGENSITCIEDCASGDVKFSLETEMLLEKNNNIIKDQKTGRVLLKGNIPKKQIKDEGVRSRNNKAWNISLIVLLLFIVASIIFIVRKKLMQK